MSKTRREKYRRHIATPAERLSRVGLLATSGHIRRVEQFDSNDMAEDTDAESDADREARRREGNPKGSEALARSLRKFSNLFKENKLK